MNEDVMGFECAADADSDAIVKFAERAAPRLPMLDAYLDMMRASALVAAGKIGVFEALARGPLATDALASSIHASEIGVRRLTDLLVEAGHLERRGDLLANAPETTRWFTSSGEVDYRTGLVWTADAWTIMGELSEAVRRGEPQRLLWGRMDEAPWLGERFSQYMRAFAHHLSPDLLDLVEVPERPARLLDLGGSHGVHAISFCQLHPQLSAVIVDFESALHGTRARINALGLGDRIAVRPGDIRACGWDEGYDLVFYLSIAHNMHAEENARIFAHLRTVMRPGGKLVLHDYPAETTPGLFGAAFGLTLLVETGTRTFNYAELSDMLVRAGFSAIRKHVLAPAEKGTIIIAERW